MPAPPQNTAVGGKASLLPKRTPVSDREIEAILVSKIVSLSGYCVNSYRWGEGRVENILKNSRYHLNKVIKLKRIFFILNSLLGIDFAIIIK